jgi:chloramphenicol O-acetyltransferase
MSQHRDHESHRSCKASNQPWHQILTNPVSRAKSKPIFAEGTWANENGKQG